MTGETRTIAGPGQVLERLAALPGGPELLALARRREDVALVGGAVRDLLCGMHPRELDVTVAPGAAAEAAGMLAASIPEQRGEEPIEPKLHQRFGTASVVGAMAGSTSPSAGRRPIPPPGPCPRSGRERSRRIWAGATSRSTP